MENSAIPEGRMPQPVLKKGPLPFRSRYATNQPRQRPHVLLDTSDAANIRGKNGLQDTSSIPKLNANGSSAVGNGFDNLSSEGQVDDGNRTFMLKSKENGASQPGQRLFQYKNPSNKENVKLWLDQSTSPTSVIIHHEATDPPSPSPICSPSPSSFPSSELPPPVIRRNGRVIDVNTRSVRPTFPHPHSPLEPSTSQRHGKGIVQCEAPPDSPTGSSHSSTSEGGLLAILANKLFSYREHHIGSSRYARERSGPIDEKHVMEDRSKKPSVEEIVVHAVAPQPSEAQHNNGPPIYRTTSEAASEFSLGSAQERTFSMEFDAMLAAAVAAGVTQANAMDNNGAHEVPTRREHELREIQEGQSLSSSFSTDHGPNITNSHQESRGSHHQVLLMPEQFAAETSNALTVMRQGRDSQEMDLGSLSEAPVSSSPSSSQGSRRADYLEANMQIVPITMHTTTRTPTSFSPDASLNSVGENTTIFHAISSSSRDTIGGHNRDTLALVLVDKEPTDGTFIARASLASSAVNRSSKDMSQIAPRQALEKVRRDKVFAQALAYQDAKSARYTNRYRREEAKITAWENQQKINATVAMKKVEMKLEAERAKALEQMQNEIALAHKRAQQKKASAEAVRACKTAKTASVADTIRRTGKLPNRHGCLPF